MKGKLIQAGTVSFGAVPLVTCKPEGGIPSCDSCGGGS
jgi:hypothetical protein